ncbi:hypothetical protein MTP99_018745 [Tenebrio molitor]|nr:hypothetical protein MTP99_018745 [Tenebrio molitor]
MEMQLVSEEIRGDLEEIQEEPKETIAILHERVEGIQGDSREKQGIPEEMKRDLSEIHSNVSDKNTGRMIKDIGRSEGNTEKSRGKQHAGKFREDTGIIKEMQLVSKEIRGDLEEIQKSRRRSIAILNGRFKGIQGDLGEKHGIPGQMKKEPREIHNGDTVKSEMKDTGRMIKDTGRSDGNTEKSRGDRGKS